MAPRRIVVVAHPDVQVLDVVGPMEVFAMANRFDEADAYGVELVTPSGAPVPSSCGLDLTPHASIDATRGAIDTMVVAGGPGTEAAVADDDLIRWIRAAAPRCRRVASVCSGAFLLAQAGLLDGRRATTHWGACDRLARAFPEVSVEPDPIFVRDGDVWTSAGVTAGMDLALALVEDDLGADLAREVARWLVLFVQRPGGQAQFSAQLAAQQPELRPLRDLQAWIADHLDEDLSVAALAERAGMSTRNFARAFARDVGVTPAAYVERTRVEAARRLLESTDQPVAGIARRCGFGTVETLHRAFRRSVRITPGQYRERFAS